MTQAPLIDFQQVSYAYPIEGQDAPALVLREITLQVTPGEYLVVLGHNGSGKSTLARHCNALLTAYSRARAGRRTRHARPAGASSDPRADRHGLSQPR